MDENEGVKKSVSIIYSYIAERREYLENLNEIKIKMIKITDAQSYRFHDYHSSLKRHVKGIKDKKDLSELFNDNFGSIELEELENDCVKLKQEIDEISYLLLKHSFFYNKYKFITDESVKKHIDEIKKELDKNTSSS